MKKFICLLIMLLTLTTFFGCSGKNQNQVNIGYFNNITHPQALYMKSQKSLEKAYGEDIQVNWTSFNAGPAEVTALFSGNIDIGYIGPVPAINSNSKTMGDVVILTGATKGGAVMITRKGANIKKLSDLNGKKVAIPQLGNTQHLNLLDLLEKNGMKPTTDGGQVTVCAVANADVANTMERGDIDAALVPEPWGATILDLLGDEAKLFLDYDQIMGGDYDVAVVVVRKDFLKEKPDFVKTFMEQHNIATDKINSDLEKSINIINKELENATGKLLDDEIISEAFSRLIISSDINESSIANFAKISKEQGFITEAVKDEDLYADTQQ